MCSYGWIFYGEMRRDCAGIISLIKLFSYVKTFFCQYSNKLAKDTGHVSENAQENRETKPEVSRSYDFLNTWCNT